MLGIFLNTKLAFLLSKAFGFWWYPNAQLGIQKNQA